MEPKGASLDLRCFRCGYSLAGLAETSACPECGVSVDRSVAMGAALDAELRHPRLFGVALAAAAAGGAAEICGYLIVAILGAQLLPMLSVESARAAWWLLFIGGSVAAIAWISLAVLKGDVAQRMLAAAACLIALVQVSFFGASGTNAMDVLWSFQSEITVLLITLTLLVRGLWTRRALESWNTRRSLNVFTWQAWAVVGGLGVAIVSFLLSFVLGNEWFWVFTSSLGLFVTLGATVAAQVCVCLDVRLRILLGGTGK
jgi:hypothetical protein